MIRPWPGADDPLEPEVTPDEAIISFDPMNDVITDYVIEWVIPFGGDWGCRWANPDWIGKPGTTPEFELKPEVTNQALDYHYYNVTSGFLCGFVDFDWFELPVDPELLPVGGRFKSFLKSFSAFSRDIKYGAEISPKSFDESYRWF